VNIHAGVVQSAISPERARRSESLPRNTEEEIDMKTFISTITTILITSLLLAGPAMATVQPTTVQEGGTQIPATGDESHLASPADSC